MIEPNKIAIKIAIMEFVLNESFNKLNRTMLKNKEIEKSNKIIISPSI